MTTICKKSTNPTITPAITVERGGGEICEICTRLSGGGVFTLEKCQDVHNLKTKLYQTQETFCANFYDKQQTVEAHHEIFVIMFPTLPSFSPLVMLIIHSFQYSRDPVSWFNGLLENAVFFIEKESIFPNESWKRQEEGGKFSEKICWKLQIAMKSIGQFNPESKTGLDQYLK
nr:924_t:CDS:2 [Entrophospora candida]